MENHATSDTKADTRMERVATPSYVLSKVYKGPGRLKVVWPAPILTEGPCNDFCVLFLGSIFTAGAFICTYTLIVTGICWSWWFVACCAVWLKAALLLNAYFYIMWRFVLMFARRELEIVGNRFRCCRVFPYWRKVQAEINEQKGGTWYRLTKKPELENFGNEDGDSWEIVLVHPDDSCKESNNCSHRELEWLLERIRATVSLEGETQEV